MSTPSRYLRALRHAPLRIWIALYAAVGLCVMIAQRRGPGIAPLVVLVGAAGASVWKWHQDGLNGGPDQ